MSEQQPQAPSEVYTGALSSIEEVVEEARSGRMFILVDDENRENEGDICVVAQMATPEVINFMAKHARGLICLSMTRDRIEKLGLPLMSSRNETRHETAFTVSIEAREGVTTGISAHDRAHTIQVAIDPQRGREDIVTPGHVFPLMAREGGTLVRAGHTEAVVDIARMAGLNPSGVICEIMNDDGTMARLPDLLGFAREHGLKVATIADLIAYRRRTEKLISNIAECDFHSRWGGDFRMLVYANKVEYAEHIALVKGEIRPDRPVLVRMHATNILGDILGADGHRTGVLSGAMRMIGEAGAGVIVIIREPRAT
ncbi:MAG: 3,4-dihydroxy-2-butanone-4-phosphate synthase, partial [Thalassobaculaceae bacterium]